MAISQFPAPSGSGGLTNDFILDKNGTTNDSFDLGRDFAAGGYSVVVTGSTAYDIYLLDANGSAVGYTNGTSVVASDRFIEVSALGLGTADTVAFAYSGPSSNATAKGTEPGAGAYLVSVTPSDLPEIDDTAVVAGGNFASDVEFSFISGTVVLPAKNVVVGSSTAVVVTRPDGLIEDLAPYDLKAVNPGVQEPVATGSNILAGTITAGTDPAFVTTSPILGAFPNTAYSSAILVSDSDGTVVNWQVTAGTLPTGLTLGTADGSLAGTPTVAGEFTFTVQITDSGDNTNSREFIMPIGLVISGTGANSTAVGGFNYVWWESTGDLQFSNASSTAVEFIAIAGGGGGGDEDGPGVSNLTGGGGGAGGLLWGTATLDGVGSAVITVGAGGAGGENRTNGGVGTNTVWVGFGTAFGGGGGGQALTNGLNGGSGGGGGDFASAGGLGTAGQGNNGDGVQGPQQGYGGGGAGAAGSGLNGGNGRQFGAWASAVGIIYDAGYFAGGGASLTRNGATIGTAGLGGGGFPGVPNAGSVNSGGGGGAAGSAIPAIAGAGGSGLMMVRFTT